MRSKYSGQLEVISFLILFFMWNCESLHFHWLAHNPFYSNLCFLYFFICLFFSSVHLCFLWSFQHPAPITSITYFHLFSHFPYLFLLHLSSGSSDLPSSPVISPPLCTHQPLLIFLIFLHNLHIFSLILFARCLFSSPRLHLNNTNLFYICQLCDDLTFMNIIEYVPAFGSWSQRAWK